MTETNLPQVTELQDLIAKSGLSADTGAMIYKEFSPLASAVADLATKAHAIAVTDATQLTEMKQAREIRMALVKVRKDAERKKTELKEDSNRYGKTVQSAYNTLDVISKTAEDHAEKQEKFAQIQEEKRQAELRTTRQDDLAQYQAFLPPMGDLGKMTANEFAVVLDMAKAQKQKREEMEAQERKEAQEKAEAEAKEREALKLAAQEAEAKRKEAEAALAAERAERERIEAEAKAKEAAAQREAEAKRKEAEAAEAAKAAAPDREKLRVFESEMRNYQMPELSTEAGRVAAGRAKVLLTKIADDIAQQITKWGV